MRTTALCATLLTTALWAASPAQVLDTAKLDQFLDRLAQKNKGMGTLTLARDGRVVYSRSFGYRLVSGAERIPADAATKYRIASITKTYTTVMAFQLVEEGALKLSDTLDRFFPQIPNAKTITLAHLLSHRSGIADLVPDGSWGMQPRTKEEVLAAIASRPPEFPPDAKVGYSNAAYIILGYVVEKAAGKPYREVLRKRIAAKIGLTDTYVRDTGGTDPAKNESVSYRFLDGWREAAELDFSVPAGAGAILSSTADMTKFIQALFDLKLISAASLKQMMTIRDGEGMGIGPFTFAGKTLYGHTGGSGSSGAWLAYEPQEKLALAYATNMKIYPVADIVSGVLDIYWNRPFTIPTFEAFEVSPEILDRYVGVYSTPGAPNKLTITRRGNTLYFQPGAQSAVPLEATAEDKFKIDPGVFFEFDAAKGTMTIKRPNGQAVFTKEK